MKLCFQVVKRQKRLQRINHNNAQGFYRKVKVLWLQRIMLKCGLLQAEEDGNAVSETESSSVKLSVVFLNERERYHLAN